MAQSIKLMKVQIASRIRRVIRDFKYRRWMNSEEGLRNKIALRSLRGRHKGRRCLVIGNGPSLKLSRLPEFKDDVTIGCNSLFLFFEVMGYVPTYYTVEDPLVAADRCGELRRISGTTKVYPFDLYKTLSPDACIWVRFDRDYPGFPVFSWDLEDAAYWGGTVTFFNLQLAYYLGCNPIILTGVDHSYNTTMPVSKDKNVWTSTGQDVNHFSPEYFGKGYRWHDPNVERMEQAYRCAREFADRNGVEILNATVGGKLEVFKRVSIDFLLAQNG